MHKKRPFLLLEILISLVLTALLLSCVFGFWVGSVKTEVKLCKTREEGLARAYVQTRLEQIFTGLIAGDPKGSIYTQDESLVVVFNNGIDPDPSFSGPILAKIYLDEEHNLALALWPKEEVKKKERIWRKEVLLRNVSQCNWEFLGEKQGISTPEKKRVAVRSVNGSLEWCSNWPLSFAGIPAVVRLVIALPDTVPLHFAFRVPAGALIPTYMEGLKT